MTREVVDRDFNRMTKSTSDDAIVMGILEKESPQPKRRLRLVA